MIGDCCKSAPASKKDLTSGGNHLPSLGWSKLHYKIFININKMLAAPDPEVSMKLGIAAVARRNVAVPSHQRKKGLVREFQASTF